MSRASVCLKRIQLKPRSQDPVTPNDQPMPKVIVQHSTFRPNKAFKNFQRKANGKVIVKLLEGEVRVMLGLFYRRPMLTSALSAPCYTRELLFDGRQRSGHDSGQYPQPGLRPSSCPRPSVLRTTGDTVSRGFRRSRVRGPSP